MEDIRGLTNRQSCLPARPLRSGRRDRTPHRNDRAPLRAFDCHPRKRDEITELGIEGGYSQLVRFARACGSNALIFRLGASGFAVAIRRNSRCGG